MALHGISTTNAEAPAKKASSTSGKGDMTSTKIGGAGELKGANRRKTR